MTSHSSSSLFHYLHKHKAVAVLPNGADGWSVQSGPTFVPYPHAFLNFYQHGVGITVFKPSRFREVNVYDTGRIIQEESHHWEIG